MREDGVRMIGLTGVLPVSLRSNVPATRPGSISLGNFHRRKRRARPGDAVGRLCAGGPDQAAAYSRRRTSAPLIRGACRLSGGRANTSVESSQPGRGLK